MIDYDKYIGIPFVDGGRAISGLDCWGLVKLIYKNEYNIELPDYYCSCNSYAMVGSLMANEKNKYWERVENPKEGNIITFEGLVPELEYAITHVGIVINDTHFIHAIQDIGVSAKHLHRGFWSERIEGFYQWKG